MPLINKKQMPLALTTPLKITSLVTQQVNNKAAKIAKPVYLNRVVKILILQLSFLSAL